MERIQINLKRIDWCCADYGITRSELASEVKVAPSSIESAGEKGITFKQLQDIANYFGRGVLFFLETEAIDDTRVHTPQFRSLANQKIELSAKIKKLIERVERQREIYLSLCEEIDDIERTRFTPPNVSGQNSREAARIVRQWLGLASKNSFDDYRAAVEARGTLVFCSNGYNGEWQIAKESPIIGFSLYYSTCPVIVVKKQESSARQSFTLMHELAHLLLHKTSSIDDNNDLQNYQGQEREANEFAGHLLVPDIFLANIDDEKRPDEVAQYDEWLKPQREAWGVSGEVILLRLLNAGRLPHFQYMTYRQWKEQLVPPKISAPIPRAYRHREPKNIFGDNFVRTVFDALSAKRITLPKASSYLDNIKITDLHQLERHIASL
jgi:Zn-dependent peptidase ImmA (M78 family)